MPNPRFTTTSPRFDPHMPIVVNGFRFDPARVAFAEELQPQDPERGLWARIREMFRGR